jgi:hypothetical protein
MTKTPKERSLARDVALLVVGALIAFAVDEYGGAHQQPARTASSCLDRSSVQLQRARRGPRSPKTGKTPGKDVSPTCAAP